MGQVYAIRQAGPAAVWVVAEGGLWCWEGTRWRRRLAGYDVVAHSVFELADESALAYIENPLSLRGLWEWQGESGPRPLRHVVQTTIASIAIGPAAETVVVHNTGDVMLRSGDGWMTLPGPPAATSEARAAGYLSNGDLWIATDRGLYLHRRSSMLWHAHVIPHPDERNTVNAIALLPDGRVLLGTGRGVAETVPDNSATEPPKSVSSDTYPITGVAVDRSGRVWASSGYGFTGARVRDTGGGWRAARLDPMIDRAYAHRITTAARAECGSCRCRGNR